MVDEEAVATIARRFGLLLLPGGAFRASGVLSLSYGGLTDAHEAESAAARLAEAARALCTCCAHGSGGSSVLFRSDGRLTFPRPWYADAGH